MLLRLIFGVIMLYDYKSAANSIVLVVVCPLDQLDVYYAAHLHGSSSDMPYVDTS